MPILKSSIYSTYADAIRNAGVYYRVELRFERKQNRQGYWRERIVERRVIDQSGRVIYHDTDTPANIPAA